MMADNAGFVVAAYVVTAICLAAYWRFLHRRDKELSDRSRPR
jgi:hypothetical protein